jgi:hypothetical protein
VIQASSWVIDGMPAGLAFREGKAGENFGDLSPFLLHTVRRDPAHSTYSFDQTAEMKILRDDLYKKDSVDDPTAVYTKNKIKV